MASSPSNSTLSDQIASYDIHGAIVYIVGVIMWYGVGFVLILLDSVRPRSDHALNRRYPNVYQAVSDLHEQNVRNEILLELKDDETRKKLWQIYYGATNSPPLIVEKDKETVHSIKKQLNELTEQRRVLRRAVFGMSFDQADGDDDGPESESIFTRHS